jgi:hypothetical protein
MKIFPDASIVPSSDCPVTGRPGIDGNYPAPVSNKRAALKIGPGRAQGQNHAVMYVQPGTTTILSVSLYSPGSLSGPSSRGWM